MIEYEDIKIGVQRTLTKRWKGVIYHKGVMLAKDDKAYSNRDKALSRAQLIKDLTWRIAVNESKNDTKESIPEGPQQEG